jgi:hypothetical protein
VHHSQFGTLFENGSYCQLPSESCLSAPHDNQTLPRRTYPPPQRFRTHGIRRCSNLSALRYTPAIPHTKRAAPNTDKQMIIFVSDH